MAFLVLMFLDLATIPQSHGDDALYKKAMADHHLTGPYMLNLRGEECAQIARNSSDLQSLGIRFEAANQVAFGPARKSSTHFSRIGWEGSRAWLQLKTLDATSCLLYQRVGASFRLVREIRLPH